MQKTALDPVIVEVVRKKINTCKLASHRVG
jgi:hypothetical protein